MGPKTLALSFSLSSSSPPGERAARLYFFKSQAQRFLVRALRTEAGLVFLAFLFNCFFFSFWRGRGRAFCSRRLNRPRLSENAFACTSF